MKFALVCLSFCLVIHITIAPPPRKVPTKDTHNESQEKNEIDDFDLEYNRYLREVINLLESDPEFKKKLEDAHEVDIRSGVIAKELEFVDHKVRTKLDEVKRQEIERLRHLAQKQYELNNGLDVEHAKVSSEHLDEANPHTFEMEDLKKLIAKVSSDLNAADEKRRREFKEYEMQKEFEKQQKLKHLQGNEREAFEKQLKENETKHKQHERLHEPGSKQQLEEVWEKQDHMENQEFDPKVFFQLHDLDGNGYWDHNEVKALFLKELDKMYEAGAPEDDMKERVEEMERMREHVFKETDKNKDGLISYEEFLETTKQPDFEKDPGWESLDQKPVYTHEEYLEFEKRRQQEIQKMIDQGLIPQQPIFHDPYNGQGHYVQYNHQQVPGHPAVQLQGKDYRYATNFQNSVQQPAYMHQQQPHIQNNLPQRQQQEVYNQIPQQINRNTAQQMKQMNQLAAQQAQQMQQMNQYAAQQAQMNQHAAQQAQQMQQMNQHAAQQAQQMQQMNQHAAQQAHQMQQMNQHAAQQAQQMQQMNQYAAQQAQVNQHVAQQPEQVNPHPNEIQQNFQQQKNQMPLSNANHSPQDYSNRLSQDQQNNQKYSDQQQFHKPGFDAKAKNANQIPNADQTNLKYSKTEGIDNKQNNLNSQHKSKQ